MVERKRLTICGLSVLLIFSVASVTAGTSLNASKSIRTNIRKSSTVDVVENSIHNIEKVNTADLLRHAVKVDKNYYLRSRMLDEGAEGEGEGQGQEEGEGNNNNNNEGNDNNEKEDSNDEEENNDKDEDNEENRDDENENAENEEQSADEENEEGEDQGEDEAEEERDDDEGDEDAAENEDDAEGEAENDDEEQQDEENDEGEEAQELESEDQQTTINFLKCVAFSIEPNVVDIDGMLENGEIDDDEAAQLEKTMVTEMTYDLNTQESIVFFTFGNGIDDEDEELFMISISDWIAASSGYDQTCNKLNEDDVETVFSKVSSKSSAANHSDHVWYAGFNCQADGNGFKPQLFLDDTCNTFSSSLNQYYPFRRETEYGSKQVASDLTQYMIGDANDSIQYSQYCDDGEFCDTLLKKSVELATCKGEGGDNNERKLESYQLENDLASNIEDACPWIQSAFGMEYGNELSTDEMVHLVSLWNNKKNAGQESDHRSIIPGTNDIWFCIGGLLVAVLIGIYLLKSTKDSIIKEPQKSLSNDTKEEPLIHRSIPRSDSDIVQVHSAIECTLAGKKKKTRSEKRKLKTMQFREYLKKSVSKESLPEKKKCDEEEEPDLASF